MKKKTSLTLILILTSILIFTVYKMWVKSNNYGAPPYTDEITENKFIKGPYDFSDWKRPEGPLKVGLQAGHWKTNEMPEEQAKIRENGGGTTSRSGVAEWEVNLKIAEETKLLLEAQGITVDILPATIPEDYWADVFVSIHADGNLNPLVSGYKIAPYRRDLTKKANILSQIVHEEYGKLTQFTEDPNITKNMTGYYAFNWRRYTHAVHPMTPAVLLELGFLTNYSEAYVLINNPEVPAQGLANGIIKYLQTYSSL